MDKRVLGVILLLLAGLSIAGYKFYSQKSGGLGGLRVTSTPTASVFSGDKLLGRTPYEDKLQSGDYIIKLIPEGTSTTTTTWQGKVAVHSGVLTFVNRELSSNDLTQAGEILTLEKISDKDAQIAVLTNPDGSTVSLDGQEKGASPLILRNLSAGDHDISVSSPGFLTRSIKVKTTPGFKLTADFQLALAGGGQASPSATPTGTAAGPGKPYVTIKDTPTGWLNVRSDPSLTATVSAKVNPGEKYSLLDTNDGWYKISYDSGKQQGWISSQYADKQE